jgi:NAD(P)-dependent dehydrogenase (short-subunit alcohol dehydrogenase family)
MQLGIEGKKALVTGAGRGLGRSISLNLAREGAVVAAISRTDSDLRTLVEEMGGSSVGHCAFAADLLPEKAPKRVLEELNAKFGRFDIVVHNLGGTLGIRDPFSCLEEWRKVWRFNIEVAIEMNRLLVPPMKANKWGRIVHISSIASIRGRASVPYATVKAALNAYVRGVGCEVAADGVIISAVMPGAILGVGGHWDIVSREDPEYVQTYLSERIATGRFSTPEEVSSLVTFLCSEQASAFAGAVIPIDGGTW